VGSFHLLIVCLTEGTDFKTGVLKESWGIKMYEWEQELAKGIRYMEDRDMRNRRGKEAAGTIG
jgi:hypothetical protein